jgi:predicted nucleic acid-binding Zn ribbon protein
VRRLGPRPLARALEDLTREASPGTALARVQAVWSASVGEVVAAEAEPVGERDGVVTVACRASVWAQELELLAEDLRGRLNAALGPPEVVRELRFRTGTGKSP